MGLLNHVFDADAEHGAAGVTALLHKGRIVLIADTLVHEWPEAEDLANIAERAADVARDFGLNHWRFRVFRHLAIPYRTG